jgi:WD40 repeat protein
MKVIEFRGHERPVNQIQLNRDGDLLFTCGSDKIVNMYDLYTYERIG